VSVGFIFDLSSSTTQSRNATLEFVAAPALAPAEVEVDANLMTRYEEELKHVRPPWVPRL
jgi:hypothetical protein